MKTDSPDLTIYVDTNCFIELRDLQDLPWKEIVPHEVKKVEIAVPRVVISELDKMKSDRSSDRRRNRSRRALSLIATAIEEVNERVALKNSTVDLSLRICRGSNLPWQEYPDLDRDSTDDKIVLCAVSESIEGNKLLLSTDTGPYLSAKHLRLQAARPPETWHIPADDSAEVQEITKLRRQLAEATATRPEIGIDFLNNSQPIDLFEFTALRVPPLPQDKQEELLHQFLDILNRSAFMDNTFMNKAREYVGNLHRAVSGASNCNKISCRIRNLSGVTAQRMIFEVSAPAGTFLYGRESDSRRVKAQLDPPQPQRPKSDYDFGISLIPEIYRPRAEEPRNPTRFYWQECPEFESAFASKICEEFRAREEYTGHLWVLRSSSVPAVTGSIAVEISATNLAYPVKRKAGLKITQREAMWADSQVQALLPSWIAKNLLAL